LDIGWCERVLAGWPSALMSLRV